jgi:hypothetical protein
MAIASWGAGFKTWGEMFQTQAIFGLIGILGSNLVANLASNVLKTPPIVTETPVPKITTVVTTTEPKPEVPK